MLAASSEEYTISPAKLPMTDGRPLIIGICGGTGSGKTTITRRIIEALSETNVIVLSRIITIEIIPECPSKSA